MKWRFLHYLFLLTSISLSLSATEWSIQGLQVNKSSEFLHLNIKKALLLEQDLEFTDLEYICFDSKSLYPVHNCNEGTVKVTIAGDTYLLNVSVRMDLKNKQWLINISNQQKSINLIIDSKKPNQVELSVQDLPLKEIADLLKAKLDFDLGEIGGSLNSAIKLSFEHDLSLDLRYSIESFNWESPDASFIFADVNLDGQAVAVEKNGAIEIYPEIMIDKGESLIKDLYMAFEQTPILSNARIRFAKNKFQQFQLELSSENTFSSQIDLKQWQEHYVPNQIDVNYKIDDLDGFYNGFLVSYFELLGVIDGEINGSILGEMRIESGQLSSALTEVISLNALIPSKKIEINDLQGRLNWKSSIEFNQSNISWGDFLLAGMPIQQAAIQFDSNHNELRLSKNTKIPIFDGSVLINNLHLKNIFDPFIEIDFNGEVLPISLELITRKLGWPIMSGNISGVIPGMKKIGSKVKFLGVLELNVFDGLMQVSDLSTERLFGVAPVVAGDIKFNGLNLEKITNTYDFGEITGLVEGYVNGLRITNWKADRLEAFIKTTKSKKVKQTISQRALDNISSIGGVQGAISNTFLKFFDSFKFSQLAIGCKLRSSVCEMSGVEASKGGYFLIKGKGVPRIDIVGFRKFIDWEVFLDRLLNANF